MWPLKYKMGDSILLLSTSMGISIGMKRADSMKFVKCIKRSTMYEKAQFYKPELA